MTQQKETTILLLSLITTLAVIGGGVWLLKDKLLPNQAGSTGLSNNATNGKITGERHSLGQTILLSSNPQKQKGVEAFKNNDFVAASQLFNASLQTQHNDAEALIYLNNAQAAQLNPVNRFLKGHKEIYYEDLPTQEEREELASHNPNTKVIEVYPKTILNRVESPDIPLEWSMNPYQGCEHGCVYCYARNSHEYWDYSAGMDFERNILVKKSAPELLRKTLSKPNWVAAPVMLSGNTDCYQPIERQMGITRGLLEVFWEFRHPVGIITKNSMIGRDIDLLKLLAENRLVHVVLSLTTLDEELKRIMEPRTSSARNVLRTIRSLSEAGIPVSVNVAPIIPAINDDGIFELVKTVADAGAYNANYIIVRLNGAIGQVFEDWLQKNFPDRVDKVLNRIKAMHGGKVSDSNFGRRMRGEGEWADLISKQFKLAKSKYFKNRIAPSFDLELFEKHKEKQLRLF
jgi:DNA repair photolyase